MAETRITPHEILLPVKPVSSRRRSSPLLLNLLPWSGHRLWIKPDSSRSWCSTGA
jgi:hypothetical protein